MAESWQSPGLEYGPFGKEGGRLKKLIIANNYNRSEDMRVQGVKKSLW